MEKKLKSIKAWAVYNLEKEDLMLANFDHAVSVYETEVWAKAVASGIFHPKCEVIPVIITPYAKPKRTK